MPTVRCGFDDAPGAPGSQALITYGPTLYVDIGYDPNWNHTLGATPAPARRGLPALVDTGALESFIDNQLALDIGLPVVDKGWISGVGGRHEVNIYMAQVHVPSFPFTIWGRFAAADLSGGGMQHRALIGRTFLVRFTLSYNGPTGTVEIVW
jgi:hypothetical protein